MTFFEMTRAWWRLRGLKPIGLSIDITNRCPLSCSGCYMKWYGSEADLPRERWEEIITAVPERERLFCAWTGGEPLLRADDIRALSRHFRWTWVATNGSVPIPDLPRTTFFVSVDGPPEVHDSLRGGWADVAKHVTPECYIACTVRRENSRAETLRELARYWHGKARGIVFGFVTGRRGHAEETLPYDERARVLATVKELRRELGPFVLGARGQLIDSSRTAWRGRCPAAATLVTYDVRGERKGPCTLGPDVDCDACGCAVPGFLGRVRRLSPATVGEVARLFSSSGRARCDGGDAG